MARLRAEPYSWCQRWRARAGGMGGLSRDGIAKARQLTLRRAQCKSSGGARNASAMSQEFPLVYGMSRSNRTFCISLGGFVFAAAGAGAVYFPFFYAHGDMNLAVMVGLCVAFMLLGLACIGSALRLRIVVHADE